MILLWGTIVGTLDIRFPAYSKSKCLSITLDIIKISKGEPIFDLILWVEMLANVGVVLNFGQEAIYS